MVNLNCTSTNTKQSIQSESNSNTSSSDSYHAELQATLENEIKRFTDFVANEFEYPDSAKEYCLEGEMIIRVVYNNGFESVEITKSIDPLLEDMVMEKIEEYIKAFDRKYVDAPRLVFKIPIEFRMEG